MSTMHETHSATAAAADTGEQAAAAGGRSVRPRLTWKQRFSNNWPVVPLRLFLGALFLFAAYAKFNYPGFFGSSSPVGLKHLIDTARPGSPIKSALKPVSNNASLFGHIAAGAEIAIGAALVIGFFARIAALGGIAYTTIIVLSIHWDNVRQYTGSGGWFTSVDIAVAVALTTFLLGGAGPLSIDRLFSYLRARRDAADDAEPSFYDSDTAESRRRLSPQEEYPPGPEYPTTAIGYPVSAPSYPPAAPRYPQDPPVSPPSVPVHYSRADEHTEQFAAAPSDETRHFPDPAATVASEPAAHVDADPVAASATDTDPVLPVSRSEELANQQPTVAHRYPQPADLEPDETDELEPDPRGDVAEAGSAVAPERPHAEPPRLDRSH